MGFRNLGFCWWEFRVGSAIFGISEVDFLLYEVWIKGVGGKELGWEEKLDEGIFGWSLGLLPRAA